MDIRLSSDAGLRLSDGLASLRGGFMKLANALAARRASASLANPSLDALKDIGLSRSDLPAMRAGLIGGDDTRRKR